TGLAKSTIMDKLNHMSIRHDPTFPKSVPLSDSPNGARGFIDLEIEWWVNSRIAVRELELQQSLPVSPAQQLTEIPESANHFGGKS
ncbi:MAG: hypothetical protein WAT12_16010, partial [Candidatus Nitrotoga sp.]